MGMAQMPFTPIENTAVFADINVKRQQYFVAIGKVCDKECHQMVDK